MLTPRDPKASSSSSDPSGPLALAPVIRQVIAKWRGNASALRVNARDTVVESLIAQRADAICQCADELEAALRVLGGAPLTDTYDRLLADWRAQDVALQRIDALCGFDRHIACPADVVRNVEEALAEARGRVLGGAQTGETKDDLARVGQAATASTAPVPQPPTK